MNPLDRVIGFFAPRTALDRARARAALSLVEGVRGYDGARIGRRGNGRSPSTSANAEIGPAQVRLRNRVRDLVRNNAHAARIVDVLAAHVVGTGIVPVSRTGDAALDKRVNELWAAWSDQCDADEQLDFYGLQTLAVRSMVEAGESLCRFRPRRLDDNLPVPLQLQQLEPDHIDGTKHGLLSAGRDVLGIRFDALGKRQNYWLFRDHPGDSVATVYESVPVPAAEVLHMYRKLRPGQVRGVTAFAPVVTMARDIADYHEAALVKARIEACFAAFIKSEDNGNGGVPVGPETKGAKGERLQSLEPGAIMELRPGEDVTFATPTASSSFDPFMVHSLQAMAAGVGVTYDQVTGDLRQANYSSLRAGKIEFRRLVEQIQYQTVIPMHCAPARRRFIDAAILAGKLPRRAQGYPCEWIPPANEPIDPLKDLTADILAVRSGRMTVPQFIAGWGNDPETQLAEIARVNGLIDGLGLVLDTDPRKTSRAGLTQARPEGTVLPSTDVSGDPAA
ncbi:phage portal protein [Xanthobacter sp. YC-JY1]|uniref:phage portal protein n=1 Tax=Xanthobacter sp. YC-JY1 TaxID=2419844 RepID=UPI001F005A2F|nr:phage portal protein [Xanthobacter sp. YC-JY1]UJX46633.1 phage portal protein [Xanthobacter sp. YC-JY1]